MLKRDRPSCTRCLLIYTCEDTTPTSYHHFDFGTVYFLFGKGQEKKVFTTDLCLAHSGRNQCDEKETTISSSGGRINCSILGTG